MAGRPEGSVQTSESIIKAELRENRALLFKARKKLDAMIEDGKLGEQASVLADIIDKLSKALQGVAKQLNQPASQEDEKPMSQDDLMKILTGKGK